MSEKLTQNPVVDQNLEDFKAYIQSHYPVGTTKINLGSEYQRPVGPQGIKILINYLTWNIEYLNITMHKVGNEGLQFIIADQSDKGEQGWTSIKEIASIKNGINSEGLIGFEKLKWHNLQSFFFNQNKIDYKGIEILTRGNFSNLKKLSLGHNVLGVAGCEVLSKSQWPKFERLDLNYNIITNEGLAYLSLADWPNLLQITLSNNRLDSRAMVYIQRANWPLLEIMHISRNGIGLINESELTDFGCIQLSKMKTRRLKHFGLFGNQITLNGIRIILRAPLFVNNCFLELTKNLFTFPQVKPYLTEFNIFCNEFTD